MNSMQPTSGQGSSTEKSELTGHLDSIARAIFIIWIGTAMAAYDFASGEINML